MGTINLRVIRKTAICAWVMNYRIIIDGREIGQIKNGETKVFNVDDSKEFVFLVSVVGNSLTPHKIENFIMIDPKKTDSGEITVEIDTSTTALGFFSGGWLKEMGQISFKVEYNTNYTNATKTLSDLSSGINIQKNSGSGHSSTGVNINFGKKEPGQKGNQDIEHKDDIPQKSDRPKFCSQCGSPLNPDAKFCSKCGVPVK